MAYFSAVWLHLLVAFFSVAAVNMVLLLTIFLVCQLKELIETLLRKLTLASLIKLIELIFVRNRSLQLNLPSFESNVEI